MAWVNVLGDKIDHFFYHVSPSPCLVYLGRGVLTQDSCVDFSDVNIHTHIEVLRYLGKRISSITNRLSRSFDAVCILRHPHDVFANP